MSSARLTLTFSYAFCLFIHDVSQLHAMEKPPFEHCDISSTAHLYRAVALLRVQEVHDALAAGADITTCDAEGNTVLHHAAASGNVGIVIELLDSLHFASDGIKTAFINRQNNLGRTALHYAAFWGYTPIITRLIDAGAIVDVQDSYDNTALHYAAATGAMSAVAALLSAGANRSLRNNEGETAAVVATKHKNASIATLIEPPTSPTPTR
jgi:ankyrin repeat protein